MIEQTVHGAQARARRLDQVPHKLMSFAVATLMCLLTTSSVWADPGGGGGGLGGGGASGPEPSQWYMMLTGAVILGGIAFYRRRVQAKR